LFSFGRHNRELHLTEQFGAIGSIFKSTIGL
jgi:hypothetical protein